jgi:hypothetical protein
VSHIKHRAVPPALPQAPVQYTRVYVDKLNNVLRLYFNRLDSAIQAILEFVAGVSVNEYIAVTGAYTITTTDFLVECTSGTFAVTLPSAAALVGYSFQVKNSGTGTITVTPDGSETIDGATTKDLVQYDAMKIMSNGTNWIIV